VTAPNAQAAKKGKTAARGQIRDQGYQRYTGKYTTEGGRWALIAGRMLKMTARQPWVLVMLILCGLPTLGFGVVMWLQAKMHAAGMAPAPDGLVFGIFTKVYGTFILSFLIAMFAGGGTVADDSRGGAFQFYFARPVTREQYLIGKLVPPVVLVLSVSLGPALLLSVLRVALAKDSGDATASLMLPLKAIAMGVTEALALAVPVVALSSLSRGRGYVQAAFAGLFLLPWILGAIFVSVTRSPWPALPSLAHHLHNVARFLFQVPLEDGERALPAWISGAVLAALVVGSIAILRRRLAAMEVIGS
jgi:hypothetical protein